MIGLPPAGGTWVGGGGGGGALPDNALLYETPLFLYDPLTDEAGDYLTWST